MALLTRLHTITGRFVWDEALQMWQPNPEKPPSDCEWRVCELIRPDRNGHSDWFDVEWLKRQLPACADRIGGNGSNMFTRQLAKDFLFAPEQAQRRQGSKVIARRAYGLTKARAEQFPIRKDIRDTVSKGFCAVLHTKAQIEVDHKDGRKDNWLVNDTVHQRLEDFQALHKTANNVKRGVCANCERTNRRFDARVMGFTVGWTEGSAEYQGTCKGCFWYDPIAFRQSLISAD
jgi:hypothetical protein